MSDPRERIRPQDLAGVALVVAVGGTLVSLATRRWRWAALFAAASLTADLSARWLSRRNPAPFNARFRFVLSHSRRDRARLQEALGLHPGEDVLEVGPGAGHHAVDVARAIEPDGRLHVLDLQAEMIAAVEQRAGEHGVHNLTAHVADACNRLPFEDGTIDAAYLCSVLGELPDPDATLRELHRVVKPLGRLVVGETLLDPDFVPLPTLQRRARAAGFEFERRVGSPVYYFARLGVGEPSSTLAKQRLSGESA
jgi:SAM-dependent methyltransferase